MEKEAIVKKPQKCTFSALSIIAEENTEAIQEIRKLHDPAYERWKPHINICFPFVFPEKFEEAHEALQKEFESFPCFSITFQEIDFFAHGTVFIVPESNPKGAIHEIHQKVIKVLPDCKENRDFHPHMTIAKFNKNQVQEKAEKLESDWKKWQIKCGGLDMIVRQKDTPFRTSKKIHFKSS